MEIENIKDILFYCNVTTSSGFGHGARCSKLANIILNNNKHVILKSKKTTINMKSSHQINLNEALWHPDHGLEISTTRLSINWGPVASSCSIKFEHNKN